MRIGLIILLMTSLWACGRNEMAGEQGNSPTIGSASTSVQDVLTGNLPNSVQVLRATNDQRIYLGHDSLGRYLIWETRSESGWHKIWRSLPLYGALPEVRLEDFNADQIPDLFWTIDYDEFVGGMLVLHRSEGAIELHPGVEECQTPRIEKIGHTYQLVVYEPGVYSAEECVEPVIRRCLSTIPGSWPRYFAVEGNELKEIQRDPSYYRDLAIHYREAADLLERLIEDGAELPGTNTPANYCGEGTPEKLRQLADRADGMAG